MTTTRARGLDLSQVQGNVNFAKVREVGGFDWVTLKATEGGTYVDPLFYGYARQAKDAGLLVDAYHFLTTGSPVAPQVRHFLDVTRGILDLAPSIDFESPAPERWIPPITGDLLMKRALEALNLVEDELGAKRVNLYSYPYFVACLPKGTPEMEALVAYDLWIASYKNEKQEPTDAEGPFVPGAWEGRWCFWQWSGDKGLSAPGVNCVVDHDVYNGTREELIAYQVFPDTAGLRAALRIPVEPLPDLGYVPPPPDDAA